jgi:type IV secretory pathway VirJ component
VLTHRLLVAALRKKLEPDRSRPRYIVTEPWVGYRFAADRPTHDSARPPGCPASFPRSRQHVMRVVLAALTLSAATCTDTTALAETVEVSVRGRVVPLELYVPAPGGATRGTVIMGSGDVGWVGLAVTASEYLVSRGYVVAGVNVRRYLSSFTSGKEHATVTDIAHDYRTFAGALRSRGLLRPPVVVSGVSEGAALAVAAGGAEENHEWIAGVLTIGLPATAELAWHWSDVASWITKKDANEPSFAPADVIARISPRPLWMVQSTRDEYVPEAEYRRFESLARDPKRLVLIEASNHRFTDKIPELERQLTTGLAWIAAGGR